jgi:hypothetical protein
MDEFCRLLKVKRSRFVRSAFLAYVAKEPDKKEVRRLLLLNELDAVFREESRVRRLSNKILANNTYLADYARKLIHGGYESDLVGKFRPSLNSGPNAALAVQAFEGLFSRRLELGKRMLEISRELYPGSYEWPLGFQGPRMDIETQVRKEMSGYRKDVIE